MKLNNFVARPWTLINATQSFETSKLIIQHFYNYYDKPSEIKHFFKFADSINAAPSTCWQKLASPDLSFTKILCSQFFESQN